MAARVSPGGTIRPPAPRRPGAAAGRRRAPSGASAPASGWRGPPGRWRRRQWAARGAGAGVAGDRPGGAGGVGEAEAERQAEGRGLGLDAGGERRLAAEEAGAAGDVEDEAVAARAVAFLGHPGGEAPGPAPERGAEGLGAVRLVRPGDEGGADGAGVPERHAAAQPPDLGRAREAGEDEALRAGRRRRRAAGRRGRARPAAPARRRGGETTRRGCVGGTWDSGRTIRG